MQTLWQDLRYGARMSLKKPGFTLIAVLTLALGIGANTAIFQLLNAVRLRSLPVRNPEELAEVRIAVPRGRSGDFNGRRPELTNPLWELLQERQRAFDGLFAWSAATFDLAPRGEQRFTEDGLWVSGDFFNTLGVRPALGRVFTRADDQRGCGSPGAVISYAFWRRAYGGDPAIVGRKITLDGHPVQIIGVTEAGFFGVEVGRGFDVAVPICAQAVIESEDNRIDRRFSWWLGAIGRLKPGWTLQQATAHLNSISTGMFEETVHPGYTAGTAAKYRALKLEAQDASSGVSSLRGRYNDPLALLLAIAGLVLLIACANLANLMLARASAREREIVVRLALGASRVRLVRQLMTESLLLAALVVSQVAISVVLLVGALLFTRSLLNLMTLDAGFAQDGVLEIDLNLTQLDLPVERRYALKRELLDRLRAMPGVEAAAFVNSVPLSDNWWNEDIFVDSNKGVVKRQVNFNRVSPDYFKTLSIPLLAGRDFGDGDTVTAPKVAIVNESFARSLLDGANPLGRTFRIEVGLGEPDHVYQIVALVKDTKYMNLRENFGPIVYLAASQQEKHDSFDQILLRSNLPVASLMTEARQALGAANPGIAFHFKVFKTQIRESLIRERLMATLSGFFGAIAALLASIGLYGVLSNAVAQRTQEIGVRLALGADRGRIVKMIMREAAMLLAVGLAVGISLTLAAAKTAGALLYGLRPHDPATYLLAVTLLAAVAAAASYLPARRASRVDPMVALRCE